MEVSYEKSAYCRELLKRELVPAMGCTEPIAFAYAAAKIRELLGKEPTRIDLEVSGDLIKNTKSVIIPHTDGLSGMEAAVAAGIVAGDSSKNLEVIDEVSQQQKAAIRDFLEKDIIHIKPMKSEHPLELKVRATADGGSAALRILDRHTNIVYLEKNGVVLLEDASALSQENQNMESYVNSLTLEDIYAFSNTCRLEDIKDIKELLDHQILYNSAIAKEGLTGDWGAGIGKSFSRYHETGEPMFRAIALSAAGSDARMGGCTMPVVINSGSGNQGLTVSIPVVVYADALQSPPEKLYRALLLSNLIAIYIKLGIGYLSAYCGVVTAACASVAGIAYLQDEPKSVIWDSIENGLAICSGIICDGAKASCAAKIAMSLESAFLGYKMAKNRKKFHEGEGIMKRNLEGTVNSVRTLAKRGMAETDTVILDIMLDKA